MRNFHSLGIDTNRRTAGRIKTLCPQCTATRHNKRDKSLSVNLDTGQCHCFHCGWKAYVPDETEQRERRQRAQNRRLQQQLKHGPHASLHYQRPVFEPAGLTFSPELENYLLHVRCLSRECIAYLRLTEQTEFMPQSNTPERCICFNYFENGELVNVKYRPLQKQFKMVKDAELIPYNIDGVLDTPECIITEGEFDGASFVTAGRSDVVSVPSGANSNLTWLDRFIPTHFEDKQMLYIAVDEDAAGLKLREELVRRLGAARCKIVHFGPDCKDANEHLVRYGRESLADCLNRAEPVPMEGIFTAMDLRAELRVLYENGIGCGAETGWENFDRYCTLELQRLMIVSGRPGEGKSEWVDELVLRLLLRHDWKIAYFSPENMPVEYHYCKLIEKLTGLAFNSQTGMTEELYEKSVQFLADNVFHILPGNEEYSIDVILDRARYLVVQHGIRTFVLDPLSRVDHRLEPGQTELQYLSSLLNKLTRFAVQNRCLVILVAHPRKMNRNSVTGVTPRVEMYDIFGSSDFYNKADFGIVVERDDPKGVVRIYIDKVKFKHLGARGEVLFVYNVVNGRYSPCEAGKGESPEAVNPLFDNQNWLAGEEMGEQ